MPFLRLPLISRTVGAFGVLIAALLLLGGPIASSEPASISQKRAEVERIQAELAGIDQQVEDAAEEFNGARYELGQVQDRIADNRAQIVTTTKALAAKRKVLAARLRDIYATPEPSLAEVLITSGSITAAADQVDLLDRVGRKDAGVVGGLREGKKRLQTLRAKLIEDRATSEKQVAAAREHKATVEALMGQRQAVLASAKGELGQMLAAEQARERRAAAAAAEVARQRQAAAASTPSTPAADPQAAPAADPAASAPAADPAAATPAATPEATPALPSGSGNSAAASAAMSQLGTPYRWGGASPGGFDCSGLASWAYAQIGKSVPHYTVAIYNAFPKVPSSQLQPGDLVFYRGLGHMGIYIGGGQYVHAPQTGDVVKVSSVGGRGDYVGAVRP